MKKYITLLFAVLTTAFTLNAFAFTTPEKPTAGWYVVDQVNKLTEDQKTNLNNKIDGLNKSTKNEFAVLLLQSMDGSNIEDVAQNTFRAWGVGKADLNNGVLLVISVGDRKMRLQTGKGVEGDLPDLRAKDILDQNLKPFLKKGDFYGGIDSTITATSSFLESRANVVAPTQLDATDSAFNSNLNPKVIFGLLFLIVVSGVAVMFYIKRKSRKEEEANRLRTYRLDTINYGPLQPVSTIGLGVAAGAVAATVISEDQVAKDKKRKKEENYSSSYSSSSDSSSSSYSSSDSSSSSYDGGGFGGGDSGGGGASSDF